MKLYDVITNEIIGEIPINNGDGMQLMDKTDIPEHEKCVNCKENKRTERYIPIPYGHFSYCLKCVKNDLFYDNNNDNINIQIIFIFIYLS